MKKVIPVQIFAKEFKGIDADIHFSDLPKEILPTDIIDIRREEPYYSENESWDAFTQLIIIREREETDEEYEKRISKEKKEKDFLKEKRYQTYLKLKEEFEK